MSPSPTNGDAPGGGHALVGASLQHAVGSRVLFHPRTPGVFLEGLTSRAAAERPDGWFILGSFAGDRRGTDTWLGASGITVDLDYEDPAVPKEEGPHREVPDQMRPRLLAAIRGFDLPGFGWLTRRGLRFAVVAAEDTDDIESYRLGARTIGDKLLDHLERAGIRTWRQGYPGLKFDECSTRPTQAMRLPIANSPTFVTGMDTAVEMHQILDPADDSLTINLGRALPAPLGEALAQVATDVQIAPETVATGYLAIAATAIGNTYRVEARGFKVPLSLQFITIAMSGDGKSTVRRALRPAVEAIEKSVLARREAAAQERQAHEARLADWERHRKAKNPPRSDPRPAPPRKSPDGGERVSFILNEATLEGVAATLEDTPRGVLWQSDEADAVLGALGRYGGGDRARALDAARIRRLTDGESTEVHRARGNASQIRRLARPFLCIETDLQPDRLEAIFDTDDQRSGLTARFLIHQPETFAGSRRYLNPPPRPDAWVLPTLTTILGRLWGIPLQLEEDGAPCWKLLFLDETAEHLWATEMEAIEPRLPTVGPEERGFLGHLRGRLLRLAGVLALLRWACETNSLVCLDSLAALPTLTVIGSDMEMAIAWGRYFSAHHRVLFAESPARRQERHQLEADQFKSLATRHFAKHSARGVTPADLATSGGRRFRSTEGRAKAVSLLNAIGWAPQRVQSEGPGRPTVAWFPPTPGRTAAPKGGQTNQGNQTIDPSAPPGATGTHDEPACDLLQRASNRLLEERRVSYPERGVRGPCPACGSPDGLAALPNSDRWYCHSSRHDEHCRSGYAVDLHFAQQHGRMPTPAEAVSLSRLILGEGGTP